MKKAVKNEDNAMLEKAWKKFEKGDFEGAEGIFSDIYDEEESPAALYGRASALIRKADYAQAVEDLNDYIKQMPKDHKGFHLRGLAWGGDENYKEALKDLEKAVDLAEDKVEAYCDMGGTLLAAKDYKKAMQYFEKCVDLDKTCTDGWTGKGLAALLQKDFKNAIEFLNVALKLEPKNLMALLARVEALLALKKTAEVEKEMKKILAINPNIFSTTQGRDEDEDDEDEDDEDEDDKDEDEGSDEDEIEEFELDD